MALPDDLVLDQYRSKISTKTGQRHAIYTPFGGHVLVVIGSHATDEQQNSAGESNSSMPL
jgi:hypothetical protein